MALNLTPEEEAEERELYASLYPKKRMPAAGIGYNPDTMEANNPEEQGLLDQSIEEDEEEDEDSYPSPVAMGLLGAGASMLRQSGWRDTPITLGEQLGYAIPAGVQGYYNQEIMNRQEQEQNQAAIAAAETERANADNAEERRAAFKKLMEGSDLSPGMQQLYMQMYHDSPDKTWEKVETFIRGKKKGVTYISREQLKKDGNPMWEQVVEGGYLMLKKDGTETPVGADKQPTAKEEIDKLIPKSKVMSDPKYSHLAPGMKDGHFLKISKGAITMVDEELRPLEKPEKPAAKWEPFSKDHPSYTKYSSLEGFNSNIPYVINEATDELKKLPGSDLKQDRRIMSTKPVVKTDPNGLTYIATEQQWYDNNDPEKKVNTETIKITFPPSAPGGYNYTQIDVDKAAEEATKKGVNPKLVASITARGGPLKNQFTQINKLADEYKEGVPEEDIKNSITNIAGLIKSHKFLEDNSVEIALQMPTPQEQLDALKVIFKQLPKTKELEKRTDRAEDLHPLQKDEIELRIKQMEVTLKQSQLEPHDLMSAEDYLGKEGAFLLPEGVAIVDVQKDGLIRYFKADMTPWIPPKVSLEQRKEYRNEIQRLYKSKDLEPALDKVRAQIDSFLATGQEQKAYDVAQVALKDSYQVDPYKKLRTGQQIIDHFQGTQKIDVSNQFDAGRVYKKDPQTQEWVALGVEEEKLRFSREDALRTEFNLLTKDARVAGLAFKGLVSGVGANNGAGDIMIITSFRRMFEPDSVVREGEYAITEAAQGIYRQMQTLAKKFVEGHRLHPTARKQFLELGKEYMRGLVTYYKDQTDNYRKIGKRYYLKPDAILESIGTPLSSLDLDAGILSGEFDDKLFKDSPTGQPMIIPGKKNNTQEDANNKLDLYG